MRYINTITITIFGLQADGPITGKYKRGEGGGVISGSLWYCL